MESSVEMEPELAQRLLEEGGTLVFLNLPVGTEFGIDMKTWNTGEKFRGVKMIPPGIHMIHYSVVGKHGDIAPKVSFLHNFKKKEILAKKWDIDSEDISDWRPSEDEVQRLRDNIQDLDRFLGAYPFDIWTHWRKLSYLLTEPLVKRLAPESGLIRSAVELVSGAPKEPKRRSRGKTAEEKEEELLPNLIPKEGSSIRFTTLPDAYPEGATPSEVTQHSMDTTYVLDTLTSSLDDEMDVVGEMQFAFICFLIGQSLEALDQWRSLFKTLCHVKAGIVRRRALYSAFLKVLEAQLLYIPEDFLVDIVSSNNVIYMSLRELFRTMQEEDSGIEPRLKCEADRLKQRLSEKFGWDFEDLEEEYGDDAPVVVDLEESSTN